VSVKVGVLALQGDFREHIYSLSDCGVDAVAVKDVHELNGVEGLVIPGGESTTIFKLARSFGLLQPLRDRIAEGMPTYGSCAGMILLSREILDPASGQETFGGIDIVVRRNAFGRQTESFEADLDFRGITGPAFRGVFIRAPWVESAGPGVEILAEIEHGGTRHAVAVRQGNALATAFHPELTGDNRIHRYFIEEVLLKSTTSAR
jgi:pyridoxal 5'-phosphate synthase pdxT subunit